MSEPLLFMSTRTNYVLMSVLLPRTCSNTNNKFVRTCVHSKKRYIPGVSREEAHPEFCSGPVFERKITENRPSACFGVYNSVNNKLKSASNFVIIYHSRPSYNSVNLTLLLFDPIISL